MGGMFNGCSLSTPNYDQTLINFATITPPETAIPMNISIHFGTSKYTIGGAGEAARNTLITNYNWTILDGGGI